MYLIGPPTSGLILDILTYLTLFFVIDIDFVVVLVANPLFLKNLHQILKLKDNAFLIVSTYLIHITKILVKRLPRKLDFEAKEAI